MKLVRYFHNLFLLIFFGKTFPRYFSDLKINKVGVTGGPLSYLRPYSSVSGVKEKVQERCSSICRDPHLPNSVVVGSRTFTGQRNQDPLSSTLGFSSWALGDRWKLAQLLPQASFIFWLWALEERENWLLATVRGTALPLRYTLLWHSGSQGPELQGWGPWFTPT